MWLPIAAALFPSMMLTSCGEDTPTVAPSKSTPVAHFPKSPDPLCGDGGARLYDECGSQMRHYFDALSQAQKTGKIVLISYGAEWCIWCHVFEAHLAGAAGTFRYPVEGKDVTLTERSGRAVLPDVRALNDFASKTFVLLHLEADHAPDGREVLSATGASAHAIEGYPFIYTLTSEGRIAAIFDHDKAEVRREGFEWYRGYDRKALMAELTRMRDAAQTGKEFLPPPAPADAEGNKKP